MSINKERKLSTNLKFVQTINWRINFGRVCKPGWNVLIPCKVQSTKIIKKTNNPNITNQIRKIHSFHFFFLVSMLTRYRSYTSQLLNSLNLFQQTMSDFHKFSDVFYWTIKKNIVILCTLPSALNYSRKWKHWFLPSSLNQGKISQENKISYQCIYDY